MFTNLFNFIGKLIKGVFHFLIVFTLFLKDNLFKIGIAIAIGAVLGFISDYISPPAYNYDMIIEPNYGSIDQIYENIEHYNVLTSKKDSISLAKKFNISYETANSLVAFELTPYETKKDIILAYNEFLKETDTATHKFFSFKDFKNDVASKFDSRRYVFRIKSTSPTMEPFIEEIIKDIEINPTVQKRKRIKLQTLKLDSLAVIKSLNEIDNLRDLYKKVTLLEVEKKITPATSTYLDFSKESKKDNNDLALFNISKDLNKKLIEIEKSKETSEEIVNIITRFNPDGRKKAQIYDTKMFKYGMYLGGLMIFIILIKLINNYLVDYKNKYSDL